MYDRLDKIIESSYDGIFLTDGKGKTLKVNKAYEKLTGLKRNKLIGQRMIDLEKEGIVSKSASPEDIKSSKAVTLEQWINKQKKLLVTSNPIFDQNGDIDMANRVSKRTTSVLITGETGTGKEGIAKYIHNNSKIKKYSS